MLTLFDDSVKTWILTCVCAPQCIRNPYVTAKLVEALFVISPSVQANSGLQFSVSKIFISKAFGLTQSIAYHIKIFFIFQTKCQLEFIGYESSTRTNGFGWCSDEILH